MASSSVSPGLCSSSNVGIPASSGLRWSAAWSLAVLRFLLPHLHQRPPKNTNKIVTTGATIAMAIVSLVPNWVEFGTVEDCAVDSGVVGETWVTERVIDGMRLTIATPPVEHVTGPSCCTKDDSADWIKFEGMGDGTASEKGALSNPNWDSVWHGGPLEAVMKAPELMTV